MIEYKEGEHVWQGLGSVEREHAVSLLPRGLEGCILKRFVPGALNIWPATRGCVMYAGSQGDVLGKKLLMQIGFALADAFTDSEARGGASGPKPTDGDEPWRPVKRCGLDGVEPGKGEALFAGGDKTPFVGLLTFSYSPRPLVLGRTPRVHPRHARPALQP